jgi:hypothetical protein
MNRAHASAHKQSRDIHNAGTHKNTVGAAPPRAAVGGKDTALLHCGAAAAAAAAAKEAL